MSAGSAHQLVLLYGSPARWPAAVRCRRSTDNYRKFLGGAELRASLRAIPAGSAAICHPRPNKQQQQQQ